MSHCACRWHGHHQFASSFSALQQQITCSQRVGVSTGDVRVLTPSIRVSLLGVRKKPGTARTVHEASTMLEERNGRQAGKHRTKRRGSTTACVAAIDTSLSPAWTGKHARTEKTNEKWATNKTVDVTTLGNLCVDIVLNVPQLPPETVAEKFQYMQRLVASPPDEKCDRNSVRRFCMPMYVSTSLYFDLHSLSGADEVSGEWWQLVIAMHDVGDGLIVYKRLLQVIVQSCWEGGGNANVAIAGSRLGLNCVTLGHVGNEEFGHFLHRVLDTEGVQRVDIQGGDQSLIGDDDYDGSTLLCWVLVDPQHQHAFCSRFDFNKSPAFSQIRQLSSSAVACIQRSKALFVNGFIFDELAPSVVLAAMKCAQEAGGAVFFDPGPRAYTVFRGSAQRRHILEQLLCVSDVLLLTAEEAEALTGIADPRTSARALLERGKTTKWVVIKLGGTGCMVATSKGFHYAPAFKVEVVDTVGCGDSFAAAVILGYIMRDSVPITTTLALANAVGAATAMGQGAGRNVACASKVVELLATSLKQGTDLCLEEQPYVFSADTLMSDVSPRIPSKVPMPEAAHDALNLLNIVLNKSHNEIMV